MPMIMSDPAYYSRQTFEVQERVRAVSKSIGGTNFNPNTILEVDEIYTLERAMEHFRIMSNESMIDDVISKPWIHHIIKINGNYYLPEDLRKVSEEAIEPQREFQVGSYVNIISKSVSMELSEFQRRCGESLTHRKIERIMPITNSEIQLSRVDNVTLEDKIYVIGGNYFLLQDLQAEEVTDSLEEEILESMLGTPEPPQREFSIGDHVTIRNKSVGVTLEAFRSAHMGELINKTITSIVMKRDIVLRDCRGLENITDEELIYTIDGNYFLAQDLEAEFDIEIGNNVHYPPYITNFEEPLTTERRNVTMDWRSVQSNELVGKRVKCTWQTSGTLECTHSHIFTGFVGEAQAKHMVIDATGMRQLLPVIVGKDAEGWLIIRSAGTHHSRRGTEQKVFYQAVCPEHVDAYELQNEIEEAHERQQEVIRAAEEDARRIAERTRQAEREARAEAERVATAQREAQRQAERQAREEQQRLNAEKYNIWSYHEKGTIE